MQWRARIGLAIEPCPVSTPEQTTPRPAEELTPPPLASSPDWQLAGAAFNRLLLSWRDWVHRRTERISFLDERLARRHVQIDFTLPDVTPALRSSDGGIMLVPIMRLLKRTLTNFDLCDEGGRAVPMLAREQHRHLLSEALFLAALDELGRLTVAAEEGTSAALGSELDTELWRLCELVVRAAPGEADGALKGLYALRLDERGRTSRIARMLADSFIVVAPLAAQPGLRRQLAFSLDEFIGDPQPRLRTELDRGAAWKAKPLAFQIQGLSDVPSFHLDIEAPPGLWIVHRELWVSDEPVRHPPGPPTRARFYVRPSANSEGLATIRLRPQTSTIIRAAALVSWLAFSLLAATFLALWFGGFRDNDSNVPGLLLFLPGAVSALLVRSGEHPMTSDMLWMVRTLTLFPSALAFIGGAAFAALPHGSSALMYLFGPLTIGAYIATAVLTMGWRLCVYAPDPEQRARPRAAHTY